MTVDVRTRPISAAGPVDPEAFFEVDWPEAVARNGLRAATDAALLALGPLTIRVDDGAWTITPRERTIDVVPGGASSEPSVTLDRSAFADLFCERRTAMGLIVGERVGGDSPSQQAFYEWDPVLRSLLDGRPVYRPGAVPLQSLDGSPLELDQRFRPGEQTTEAAHFLAETGFLLLQDFFTEAEVDEIDADLAGAVTSARVDDGSSWWATTRGGERYPCRILDFAAKSPALRALFANPRYTAIGDMLGHGHRPGDPFGEHFADVTAEGLLKRVDSVDGLVCLPWHKDCDRGGHSMFCAGLTIGICLTPVDEAHGGLDVMAGSHRANIARSQIDGLDLPAVTLRAERGDLTVHMSCTLHRSTHPTTRERRVAYTGFALPPQTDDTYAEAAQSQLRSERAAIGGSNGRTQLVSQSEA
jgi:Phytanoyl-CoA dioxygenase (PhyH)